jgi:hypothetical protein
LVFKESVNHTSLGNVIGIVIGMTGENISEYKVFMSFPLEDGVDLVCPAGTEKSL